MNFPKIPGLLTKSFPLWAILLLACSGPAAPQSAGVDSPSGSSTGAALQVDKPQHVFIQLTDPLDEPEFYCVDVPGAGAGVRLESALQAHTCKPLETAADELFTLHRPGEGQIYMAAYDLCVEAEEAAEGSSLSLQRCSDPENQLFFLDNDVIRLNSAADSALCLAVDSAPGIPTGGPSHLRRALTLENCETTERALMSWSVGLFDY